MTLHLVTATPTTWKPPFAFELRPAAAWALSDTAALATLAHRIDEYVPGADAAARALDEGYRLGYGRRLSRR